MKSSSSPNWFRFGLYWLAVAVLSIPARAQTPFLIASGSTPHLGVSAAFDGTNYLVALQSGTDVGFQMLSQDGSPLGSFVSVGQSKGSPKVSYAGGQYLVVWSNDFLDNGPNVFGQLVSPIGAKVGSAFLIASGTVGDPHATQFSVASDGTDWMVLWGGIQQDGDLNYELFAQKVRANGTLNGGGVQIGSYSGGQPAVAFDGTNYLAVWQRREPGEVEHHDTQGRFISASGTVSPSTLTISQNPSSSYNPIDLAFDGTNYLVVWNRDIGPGYPSPTQFDIYARLLAPNGSFPADEFAVTAASGDQVLPRVAFDGSDYLITWTNASLSSPPDTCEGRFVTSAGQPLGAFFTLFGSETTSTPSSGVISPLFDGSRFLIVGSFHFAFDNSNVLTSGTVDGLFLNPLSDPATALVSKFHYYSQTAADTVLDDNSRGGPFQFLVQIDGYDGDTDNKTVTPPNASAQSLVYNSDQDEWLFPVNPGAYASQGAMDAAYPDGTYQLALAGTSDAISLNGDTYPNAPVVTVNQGSWSKGELIVDSTQSLTLTVNFTTNFVANHAHSSIEFQSAPGDDYFQHADSGISNLSQNQFVMTIPANALATGSVHKVLLHLDYIVGADLSSAPGYLIASIYESMTTLSVHAVDGGLAALPVITSQPASTTAAAGADTNLTLHATAGVSLAYQWQLNGLDLPGANSSTYSLANIGPANAGIYTGLVIGGATTSSDSVIVGVTTTSAVTGDGTVVGTDIVHPNGNHFDQVLVTGPAESVTSAYASNRITRTSFIDLNDDIVQVEFSGHGTLSLVLDGSSGPAAPLNYNQPTVSYMKGRASLVIAGADETTNVLVFTVGRATAFDPTGHYNILLAPGPTNVPANNGSPLFVGHDDTTYHAIAEIGYIAIESTDGKFGGLRASDANFSASQGLTGIYAPGVAFQGPVYVGNIGAQGSATPVIIIGSTSDARITGGSLRQYNDSAIEVAGLTQLKFTAGSDSGGNLYPAQDNEAVLTQDGQDVTAQIVVNPNQ